MNCFTSSLHLAPDTDDDVSALPPAFWRVATLSAAALLIVSVTARLAIQAALG